MLEQTVNLKIEETYPKLKYALAAKACKVISKEPAKQISLKQGSLWGISPQTAKKIITVKLEPVGEGLALFLSVIILLEIIIVIYARYKIDVFTKETLNQLS